MITNPEDAILCVSPKVFRVWDKKLRKFIPWNCFIRFDDPDYIVQQQTGRISCTDQPIYEGDILSWCHSLKYRGVMRFMCGSWSVADKRGVKVQWDNEQWNMGIVGNVCENPELLA